MGYALLGELLARMHAMPWDAVIARELLRTGKPVVLALNKAEGLEPDLIAADFHSLGLGAPLAIAAITAASIRW